MIGEVLVAARAITRAQLDEALEEQRRSGGFLGDVLVSMRAISGDDLAKALAAEARVPFASLEGAAPDMDAAALIPEDLARRGMCVPVTPPRAAGRTMIAQANPFDVVTVDEIQRLILTPIDLVGAPGAWDLLPEIPKGRTVALGLIDARNTRLESPDAVAAAVARARGLRSDLDYQLSPTASLEYLPADTAEKKLERLVASAALASKGGA